MGECVWCRIKAGARVRTRGGVVCVLKHSAASSLLPLLHCLPLARPPEAARSRSPLDHSPGPRPTDYRRTKVKQILEPPGPRPTDYRRTKVKQILEPSGSS